MEEETVNPLRSENAIGSSEPPAVASQESSQESHLPPKHQAPNVPLKSVVSVAYSAELDEDDPAPARSSAVDLEATVAPHDEVSLHISELSFLPSSKPVLKMAEYVRYHLTLMNLGWLLLSYKGPSRKELLHGAELRSMNITAHTGELVAVLGNAVERFELVQLLVGRKKSGKFDGNISLSGKNIAADSNYYDHVGFVPQVR